MLSLRLIAIMVAVGATCFADDSIKPKRTEGAAKPGRIELADNRKFVSATDAQSEGSTISVKTPGALRQSINFNRQWRFQLGDVSGAEAAVFEDAGWDTANLPHSFSMPYFLADRFYVGYGWYRKQFNVPASWAEKRINLEFDGVFQVAEVFINGRRIGEHKGGYTGFTFDITDVVKTGDNVVAIRVNNNWDARLAPRAGEHVFSGGIYRNVRLVVTSPLHVAWYGTFVTTPQVSKESGTVNVKTEVANNSGATKMATVRTSILDAEGKTAAQMESMQTIAMGAIAVFDQTSAPIANPKLWSPEHPNMYSVKTVVLDDGKPVDEYTSPLGFRWFKWTADQGFFFNGEHYYFKGANVHQDHAGWGDAVAESGMFRDVKMMKDAGFDFIRGSHYPHAPAFSDACDELGMLFWSENCFWGSGGFKGDGYWTSSAYPTAPADEAGFDASAKASLREMIRIHRNHPSIIVWSMDNEVFFTEDSVMPKMRNLLKEMVALSHELDPTRPAGIGGCQRGDIDKLGDVAGYNGDGARLFPNPRVPNVVTEYGSPISDRPGKYNPGWGDLPATPGADENIIGSWRLPWRSGEVLWCGFDHGSIAGHFGAQGVADYFRLPKRQWYWYRNEYLHIPPPVWPENGIPAALKLTADKTTLKSVDGTDDAQIIVTVVDKDGKAISNCPPVRLAIESGPGEFPTGPSITFAPDSDIVIRDGMAAMEFRSYYGGKTVIRATSPGLKDATIEITSLGTPKFIAGKTASVKPRPYVRFTETSTTGSLITYGLNNPTRASSEAPGHSARLANDGNQATFWQAAAGDTNPWLQINLERIVTVSKTKLTFPTEGNWRYQIEISDDGETNWRRIADQSQTTDTAKERTDTIGDNAPQGRFLRLTFAGTPKAQTAALVEMELTGTMSQQ
jgi:beta-galactosidase